MQVDKPRRKTPGWAMPAEGSTLSPAAAKRRSLLAQLTKNEMHDTGRADTKLRGGPQNPFSWDAK